LVDNIIEINALHKSYFLAKALNGVNLQIKRGVILGLLGPNGSGKSSLLKIIAGLVHPTSGKIMVNGKKPSSHTKAEIAYLPEIDYLYSWMTVKETIDFIAAFYYDWQQERAKELLLLMGLELRQKVGNLSKGKRALLKLLLVLSRKTPLVLLDEPLSGIDPPSRSRIISAIVSEYRMGEQTIILSTHQVGETEAIFDEVVYLRDGKVALHDAAENLRINNNSSINDLWERVYN
jgi:ABC-2 type transport system ATP-binding protein